MNGTDTFAAPPVPAPGLYSRIAHAFGRVFAAILEWQERAEQRGHLAAMDERMRKDIGVTYADALREAEKPFWRA